MEGIRFTQWYSSGSSCSPSRAALLTGRLPVRSGTAGRTWEPVPSRGGQPNFNYDSVGGLPLNETTIPEALKRAGYDTVMIGKFPNMCAKIFPKKCSFVPLISRFLEYLFFFTFAPFVDGDSILFLRKKRFFHIMGNENVRKNIGFWRNKEISYQQGMRKGYTSVKNR